jgi:hypothetical protein
MTFSPKAARFSALSASNTAAPDAAPGEAGRPLAMTLRRRLGIERRVEELVERGRIDAQHRFFLGDQALGGHVDGDAQSRLGGALARAGLEHPQRAALPR